MGYVFSRSFLDSPVFFETLFFFRKPILKGTAAGSEQASQPASKHSPTRNKHPKPSPQKKRKSFAVLKPILNKL
jgi:hypothetical protein